MRNVFYKLRDKGAGKRDRYTAEFYKFYPDVGPKGTPGRGPYCVSWQPLRAVDKARGLREIAERGILPLPEEVRPMRSGTLGSERISKRTWYFRGGFANSRCWRRMVSGSWQYWFRRD